MFSSPAWSLLIPGIWHWFHGRIERGFGWSIAIVLTAPLFVPAILLWVLCWIDACRLSSADD